MKTKTRTDKKFVNGHIVTLDPSVPKASAVAISRGRIGCVGSNEEVLRHGSDGAEIIELGGRTVVPGLIDSHVHAFATGMFDIAADLRGASSVGEVCAALTRQARIEGRVPWALGMGCSPWLLQEKRFPTVAELDEAVPDRPVYVCSSTFHSGATNSAGLKVLEHILPASSLGAAADKRGWFLDDESHFAAARLAFGSLADEQIALLYRSVASRAASKGVTTLHCLEGQFVEGDRDVLTLHAIAESLPVNVVLMYQTMDVQRVLDLGLPRIGGCLTVDGACFEHTACFYEPYVDRPDTCGCLNYSEEVVRDFVMEAHRAGLQIGMHAIGDRAIDVLVRAYAAAQALHPRLDCRHRVEHFQAPSDEALAIAHDLRLALPMQPIFSYLWDRKGADHYVAAFGPSRAERMEPFADLLQRGLRVAGGSDSPVTEIDPLLGIQAAVNNPRPSRRVPVDAALRMFTTEAAWVGREEDVTGTISVGKRADLAVLGADPFVESGAIHEIPIEMTICGGEIVFSR